MIKTNIKMRVTPEQSAKVQEICFKNGIIEISKYIPKNCNHFLYIFKDRVGFDTIQSVNYFDAHKNKEIDPKLFIRTGGSCIEEKQEFTYPMWFKSDNWTKHTDSETCEQVENPFIDAAIETVINEEYQNAHYKAQKIDTIARCKANMTLEQQKAICIFNIDRYVHREKGQNLSDIKKTRDYLDWLEEIENQLKKDNEDYQEW